jgi:hypothetical protein
MKYSTRPTNIGFKPRSHLLAIWLAAAPAVALLGGCSSSSLSGLVDSLPRSVGLPADAPERPPEPPIYPAVHDMPPPRPNTTLSAEEQVELEKELAATRARQDNVAGSVPAGQRRARPTMPAPPPRVIPAASANSIY